MEIFGYSERGIINSLFYEIKFSQRSKELLKDFLLMIFFPYNNVEFELEDAKIFIEQSFSDFGDADVVILIKNKTKETNKENKQALFLESKVKTYNGNFSINNEFEKFKNNLRENKPVKNFSSNLFVQLYFKVRLFKALQKEENSSLKDGIIFPTCLMKRRCLPRKIGNNKVVLEATNCLKEYIQDAMFVALVPDRPENLNLFYNNDFKEYIPKELEDWNIENWGYLSWEQVYEYCTRNNLNETLKIFRWNEGQIY